MTDKPMSPFAGLDKALLRSTRQPSPPASAPTKNQQQPDIEEPTAATSPLPSGTLPTTLVEPEKPAKEEEPKQRALPVRPYESTPVREYERTPYSPKRRKLIRHPFEFYEDQVERLRQLSLEAQLRGEKTSMSEMVREALDSYLKEKKTRTSVRTSRTYGTIQPPFVSAYIYILSTELDRTKT